MRTYETIIINIMWPNAVRPDNMYTMGQDNMNNTKYWNGLIIYDIHKRQIRQLLIRL